MSTATELEQLKAAHRVTWASGDYAAVAEAFVARGRRHGRRRGRHRAGRATSSTSPPAPATPRSRPPRPARASPRSTSSPSCSRRRERTPTRRASRSSGCEGDAEALPFADASLRHASSPSSACSSRPRHEATAARARARHAPRRPHRARPLDARGLHRPAVQDDGAVHAASRPPARAPPPLYGDEDHVRALFAGHGVELGFERHHASSTRDSPAAFVEFMADHYGPILKARERLPPRAAGTRSRRTSSRSASASTTPTDGLPRAARSTSRPRAASRDDRGRRRAPSSTPARAGLPELAHGGYVAGVLAAALAADSARVRLRRPVPTGAGAADRAARARPGGAARRRPGCSPTPSRRTSCSTCPEPVAPDGGAGRLAPVPRARRTTRSRAASLRYPRIRTACASPRPGERPRASWPRTGSRPPAHAGRDGVAAAGAGQRRARLPAAVGADGPRAAGDARTASSPPCSRRGSSAPVRAGVPHVVMGWPIGRDGRRWLAGRGDLRAGRRAVRGGPPDGGGGRRVGRAARARPLVRRRRLPPPSGAGVRWRHHGRARDGRDPRRRGRAAHLRQRRRRARARARRCSRAAASASPRAPSRRRRAVAARLRDAAEPGPGARHGRGALGRRATATRSATPGRSPAPAGPVHAWELLWAEPAPRTRVRLCGGLALEIDGERPRRARRPGRHRCSAFLAGEPGARRRARRADRGAVAAAARRATRRRRCGRSSPACAARSARPRSRAASACGCGCPSRSGPTSARRRTRSPRRASAAAGASSGRPTRAHAERGAAPAAPRLPPGRRRRVGRRGRRLEAEELELEALEWIARASLGLGRRRAAAAPSAPAASWSPARRSARRATAS